MRILITSGRSFVALEFLRILNEHDIFIQETQENFICKNSKYLKKYFITPSPKYNFEMYKKEILKIIKNEKLDLIIPTCEDIFYISRFKNEIEELSCKILCDDFEKLKLFHSKSEIMNISKNLGIEIPETKEFKSLIDLKNFLNENPDFRYVIKPKYSRFATFISSNVLKNTIGVDDIKIDLKNNSYILQEFINGENVCSYSIFNKGNLVSHVNYRSILNYKNGSTTYFESFENDKIQNFVKNFAKKHNFHGQISFDYIKNPENKIYLIECNPRTTSGIHILKNNKEFKKVFFNFINGEKYEEFILKDNIKKSFSMVNLFFTFNLKNFKSWFKSIFCDIVFDKNDIKPFLSQINLLIYYKKISKEKKLTISQATSIDIEYDGE